MVSAGVYVCMTLDRAENAQVHDVEHNYRCACTFRDAVEIRGHA